MIRGSGGVVDDKGGIDVVGFNTADEDRERSHSLMVLSNDPEATQFCSRLEEPSGVRWQKHAKAWNVPVGKTPDIVLMCPDNTLRLGLRRMWVP